MSVRTWSRRNRDGRVVRYLLLACNKWASSSKSSKLKVLYTFGRAEDLDRAVVQRLNIGAADVAPQVTCPTLITHSRGDVPVPLGQARELAALVPDSRLVVLESRNHLPTAPERAWPQFLSHVDDEFLAGGDG